MYEYYEQTNDSIEVLTGISNEHVDYKSIFNCIKTSDNESCQLFQAAGHFRHQPFFRHICNMIGT